MFLLEIHGAPIPHSSPGFTRSGIAYSRRSKEQAAIQWQIRAQYNAEGPMEGPIRINATFHLPIPKATSKTRRLQMLNGVMHHIKKPDCSNLYYFVENCLKGIVIEDDSQVVEFTARKIFGERPKTILQIEKI